MANEYHLRHYIEAHMDWVTGDAALAYTISLKEHEGPVPSQEIIDYLLAENVWLDILDKAGDSAASTHDISRRIATLSQIANVDPSSQAVIGIIQDAVSAGILTVAQKDALVGMKANRQSLADINELGAVQEGDVRRARAYARGQTVADEIANLGIDLELRERAVLDLLRPTIPDVTGEMLTVAIQILGFKSQRVAVGPERIVWRYMRDHAIAFDLTNNEIAKLIRGAFPWIDDATITKAKELEALNG